jgi:hypothetical protein
MRDICLLVISLSICSLAQWFSKYSKRLAMVYSCGSQKYEIVKESPSKSSACCCFFHENCQFFTGFEITKTDFSLILKFILRTRTGGSWFVEYLKNQNARFYKYHKITFVHLYSLRASTHLYQECCWVL